MPAQSSELEQAVVSYVPALRSFGRLLTHSSSEAEDLVQDTLVKALANINSFEPGTNMRAWLFTILRNTFYTQTRKRQREKEGMSTVASTQTAQKPNQEWAVRMSDVEDALRRLPETQREALLLVGGAGLSYEEAAAICNCALGTIKSRVNRARQGLLDLMDGQEREAPSSTGHIGPPSEH